MPLPNMPLPGFEDEWQNQAVEPIGALAAVTINF